MHSNVTRVITPIRPRLTPECWKSGCPESTVTRSPRPFTRRISRSDVDMSPYLADPP